MNGERVQWHHATLGFPFALSFIKALNRDDHITGLSSEMVRANQPISLTKSIGRMIQQRQGVQSTKPKFAAVPEEPPDPSSFCEDIDSSEFSIPSLYHNIFTKLIATSDIAALPHSRDPPVYQQPTVLVVPPNLRSLRPLPLYRTEQLWFH